MASAHVHYNLLHFTVLQPEMSFEQMALVFIGCIIHFYDVMTCCSVTTLLLPGH